jgi:hypothetical protein
MIATAFGTDGREYAVRSGCKALLEWNLRELLELCYYIPLMYSSDLRWGPLKKTINFRGMKKHTSCNQENIMQFQHWGLCWAKSRVRSWNAMMQRFFRLIWCLELSQSEGKNFLMEIMQFYFWVLLEDQCLITSTCVFFGSWVLWTILLKFEVNFITFHCFTNN